MWRAVSQLVEFNKDLEIRWCKGGGGEGERNRIRGTERGGRRGRGRGI